MPDPEAFRFRPGVLADSEAIARVHVASWEHAYGGILPRSVLDRHTVEGRTAKWEGWFRNGGHSTCWVAEEPQGQFVGFASGGPERTRDYGIDAEIYTLYVTPSRLGMGVGSRLFENVRSDLAGQGHGSMLAWVLEANSGACRFYELSGGELLAEKVMRFLGSPQKTLAYAWRGISTDLI